MTTPEGSRMEGRSLLAQLKRFVDSLHLVKRYQIVCIILIAAAASAPNLYRLFIGVFAECINGGNCTITVGYLNLRTSLLSLSCLLCFVILARGSCTISINYLGKRSSLILYCRVLNGLERVRITFFDENPSGGIRKRLTEDFARVRNYAVWDVNEATLVCADIIAGVLLIVMVSPLVAAAIIPIGAALIMIQRRDIDPLFRARNSRLKAIGVVAQSLNDLIEGRSTFRLYGKEAAMRKRVADAYRSFFDANALSTTLMSFNRFKTMTVSDCYSTLVLGSVGAACCNGYLSTATAGVVVSAVFSLSTQCRWLAMLSSYLTTHFAASERMQEYAVLPREEDEERCEELGQGGTPGMIHFSNFTASYRGDSAPVLTSLDVCIPIGKKTALMGRTGCGKSSIVQALLRMLYVRAGGIFIDGKSIYSLTAAQHREQFSIVPQYPYLFRGTIRENLDRSLSIPTEKIHLVLDQVGLDLSPDFRLREGGDNLSMGERQLLSLARALMRDSPILLMDEPTSLVDAVTDSKIQAILRKEFSKKTIITIAHRTETIEDYDFAILIDKGRILTTGSPREVLEEAQLLGRAA